MILSKQKRSAATAWLERVNPLQGLTIAQAKSIFDIARAHGSPLLQKIYDEIELTDPVLMTCVERRQSALSGLDYRFVASSSEDETLANEQRDALDKFVNGIENFWSFSKRRLAKFNGCSSDKFVLHLKECEWRYNHRNDDLSKLLKKIIKR